MDTMIEPQLKPKRKYGRWIIAALLVMLIVATAACALTATAYNPTIPEEAHVVEPTNYSDKEEANPAIIPHITPFEGPEFTPATITFSFNEVAHTLTPQVENGVYYGAIRLERWIDGDERLTFKETMQDYYGRLTFDPAMDLSIAYTCGQLREIRDAEALDVASYAELIIKYVQSFPYDMSRVQDAEADQIGEGDPRMPVQTLVDGTGDCDELAMLAAALLTHEGYGTALFLYMEQTHMVLGIQGEGRGFRGTGYEFVEMTAPAYVTDISSDLVEGVTFESTPVSIPLQKGELLYPQSAVDQIARIIRARDTAFDAAEAKRAYVEATPMTDEEFNAQVALYDACFVALNSFRSVVDEEGNPVPDAPFMDRSIALAWLDQYYWWEY